MSYHAEIWQYVDVEWDRDTNYLSIKDPDSGKQLALMRVEEVD